MALLVGNEILELQDGETKTLIISDWTLGEMDITPRSGGGQKRIRALRLHVPADQKPIGPTYWDVTGQTLIEQMLPHLQRPDFHRRRFTVTKHGIPPTARFQLRVE
ncbi:MAG: hypothetical protein A2138_26870 [Deltaproteobacteria bacterium RBG_16_71_12]|nr:MAG: hypothetical protein A2138_26870 [Deltaproteobacteria bacterium RBG_16_71_12]